MVQEYISNPHLIDNLKYDLRIYVLLYGVSPLRVFLFEDGLVRLATEPYTEPNDMNQRNLFMHLTNYALNKENSDFKQATSTEDDSGHKRTISTVYARLRQQGHDIDKIE